MSVKSKYSKDIEIGDLIAISFENSIIIGFYAGFGKTGSLHYRNLNHLATLEEIGSERIPRKDYVNSYDQDRIMKISLEMLNDEYVKQYNKAIKFIEKKKLFEI